MSGTTPDRPAAVPRRAGGGGDFKSRSRFAQVSRRLGARTSVVVACKILSSLLLLGANAMLARLLGVEAYGELSYVIGVVNLVTTLAIVGFPSLSVREIGYFTAADDLLGIHRYVRRTLGVVLVTSLVMVAATWYVLALVGYPAPGVAAVVAVGIWILPANALLRVAQPMVQGFNRPIWGIIPEYVLRPLLLFGLVGAVWVLAEGPHTPAELIALNLAAYVAATAAALALLWRLMPPATGPGEQKSLRRYFLDGTPFFVAAFMTALCNQLPLLTLGNLVDAEAVGLYRPIMLIAATLTFVLRGLNVPLRPLIARNYKQGQLLAMQRRLTRTTRLIFLCSTAIFAVFVLLGEFILGLFGEPFKAAYVPLLVLAAGQLVNVACGPVTAVLNMTEQARYTVYGMLVGVVTTVILCFALVPPLGILGAAIAAALTRFTWNVTLAVIAFRRSGIDSTIIGLTSSQLRTAREEGYGP
jgi:O-antigen/teichoic acid export membrane protein